MFSIRNQLICLSIALLLVICLQPDQVNGQLKKKKLLKGLMGAGLLKLFKSKKGNIIILMWSILIWSILIWSIQIWSIQIWSILIWSISIWSILIWSILIWSILNELILIFWLNQWQIGVFPIPLPLPLPLPIDWQTQAGLLSKNNPPAHVSHQPYA